MNFADVCMAAAKHLASVLSSVFFSSAGMVLYYCMLQLNFWWVFHVTILFWKIQFPLHALRFVHVVAFPFQNTITFPFTLSLQCFIRPLRGGESSSPKIEVPPPLIVYNYNGICAKVYPNITCIFPCFPPNISFLNKTLLSLSQFCKEDV